MVQVTLGTIEQLSEVKMYNENELICLRNKALWRSIQNFGDLSLEDEFKERCFALSRNSLVKRQFIEKVNNVKAKLIDEVVPLT